MKTVLFGDDVLNHHLRVVERYLATHPNALRSIESYDWFLTHELIDIFANDVEISRGALASSVDPSASPSANASGASAASANASAYRCRLTNPYISYPTRSVNGDGTTKMTPMICRKQNLTYESTLYVDVIQTRGEVETVSERCALCQLPVMVGSMICTTNGLTAEEKREIGECPEDRGGYFIIAGREKVIVNLEDVRYNVILVQPFKSPTRTLTGNTIVYHAITRCCNSDVNSTKSIEAFITHDGAISFDLSMTKKTKGDRHAPLDQVMKLFGVTPFMVHLNDPLLMGYPFPSQNHLENLQLGKSMEEAERNTFFHLGGDFPAVTRGMWCASIVRHLLYVFYGVKRPDNKNHLRFKRVDTPGILIGELFRKLLGVYKKTLETKLALSHSFSFEGNTDRQMISTRLLRAMHSGEWSVNRSQYTPIGVVRPLYRLSFKDSHASLDMIVRSTRGGQVVDMEHKMIHPSQLGYMCVYDTPDGKEIGSTLHHSMMSRVTHRTHRRPAMDILLRAVKFPLWNREGLCPEPPQNLELTPCFVDGVAVGYHTRENVPELISTLRELRRVKHLFHHETSIAYHDSVNEIHLEICGGRLTRALCTGPIAPTDPLDFESLLIAGKVVYLDVTEIETVNVSPSPTEFEPSRDDVCEIHPVVIFSTTTASLPFLDHNHSPRNTYASSQTKQAMGLYAQNYAERCDVDATYIMHYPQTPIVSTVSTRGCGYVRMPHGVNAFVAIATYSSMNQEDSIILNQGAIDRGMFVSETYKTIEYRVVRQDSTPRTISRITRPRLEEVKLKENLNYDKLDEGGVIRKGEFVGPHDVIFGIVDETRTDGGRSVFVDRSRTRGPDPVGQDNVRVHAAFKFVSPAGTEVAKVVLKYYRKPRVGDKFSSMCGQKGTCGAIIPHHQMMFTRNGLVPDIILNAHALPSRMTISQMMEGVLARGCIKRREFADATAFHFTEPSEGVTLIDSLVKRMEGTGIDRFCEETMFSGFTGKPLKQRIFVGVNYYQRLKHLVHDKINVRKIGGGVDEMTMQPTEGRSRGGGLRLGEMEQQALVAHGASEVLRERLFSMSDRYKVFICRECGLIRPEKHSCRGGESTTALVPMPYSFKLLWQWIQALAIRQTLHLTP